MFNLRKYWEDYASSYGKTWKSAGKRSLSASESSVIKFALKAVDRQNLRVLDIGFGTGRIIEVLNSQKSVREIWGVDFSKNMYSYTKRKFNSSRKLRSLVLHDIAAPLPFADNFFDVAVAIRVLKYNKGWKKIIKDIFRTVKKEGVLVFEMPNKVSINRFVHLVAPQVAPVYWSHAKEIKKAVYDCSSEVIYLKGGSILPDIFYDKANSPILVKAVELAEKMFKDLFGEYFLSRFLYVVCRKKPN